MTPYVELQEEIIRILRTIAEKDPAYLMDLWKAYFPGMDKETLVFKSDLDKLKSFGFQRPDDGPHPLQCWVDKAIAEIIAQQIEIKGDKIRIKNLLGMDLYNYGPPVGFEKFIQDRGNGENRLRTHRFSQPSKLKEGDILATGDKLLSPPREGGNGAILLHLTGGFDGHWISVPSRIPIALLTPEDNAPPELTQLR